MTYKDTSRRGRRKTRCKRIQEENVMKKFLSILLVVTLLAGIMPLVMAEEIENAEAPVEVVETPAEVPAESAEAPAEPAEVPAEPAETPAEAPVEAPAEPAAEPAEVPAEPAEAPADASACRTC